MTAHVATTPSWSARCKDCQAAARSSRAPSDPSFTYAADSADIALERGGTRSDRCPDCRKAHRRAIEAYPVAYVDLTTVGEVADREHPQGPFGGLGPLPVQHTRHSDPVDFSDEKFGMNDGDILRLLGELARSRRRVAVVKAGTGTGKSTFMPFRLMNPPTGAALDLRRRGPIVVTQPRVLAAQGISRFVAERLCLDHPPGCPGEHHGPGYSVGNQADGIKFYDEGCGLIYVTEGTLVNWIAQGRLARTSTVIIDEAHERSEHIDLILTMLREKLPLYPHLHVVVTSATLDVDFFVEFFGGREKVYSVEFEAAEKKFGYGIPLFPGETIDETAIVRGSEGTGDDDSFPGWPAEPVDGENLRATTKAMLALRPAKPVGDGDMAAAVAAQALRLLDNTGRGDILAFLPGARQIDAAVAAIQAGLESRRLGRVRVEGIASKVDDEIKKWATSASIDGERRVLVATTIAETSLTIKGIRYVIDSGKVTRPQWSPTLAAKSMVVADHSRSGVRQRWGRVGRDAPGWVFPLYSREDYRGFPKNTAADVTRGSLEQFRLRLQNAGIDDMDEVVMPGGFAGGTPDEHGKAELKAFAQEWARAGQALRDSGAVTPEGHLTPLGRELSGFDDVGRARALALADRLTCAPEVAVALALLGAARLVDRAGLLRYDTDWPAVWRVRASAAHRALALGCIDDLDLVLTVFARWQASEDPEGWARTWWVNPAALTAARQSAGKLLGLLSPKMRKEASRPLDLRLAGRARAALGTAFSSLRYRHTGEGRWSKPGETRTRFVLDKRAVTAPDHEIVALRQHEVAERLVSLGGVVQVPTWLDGDAVDEFELLLLAAHHEPVPALPVGAALDAVLLAWPVGSIVDASFASPESDAPIEELRRLALPPALVADLPNLDDPTKGFDTAAAAERTYTDTSLDRSSGARRTLGDDSGGRCEIADEERWQRVLSVEASEAPPDPGWDLEDTPAPRPPTTGTPAAALRARLLDGEEALRDGRTAVRAAVSGYEPAANGEITLLLSLAAATDGDPAEHPDLEFGDQIDIVVGPTVDDHEAGHRYLVRRDRQGHFLMARDAFGLSQAGTAVADALADGAEVTGTVVPGTAATEAKSLTLLPLVTSSYVGGGASSTTRPVRGRLDGQRPRRIAMSLDPRGAVPYRVGVLLTKDSKLYGTKLPVGTTLDINLRRDPVELAIRSEEQDAVTELARRSAGRLDTPTPKSVGVRHTASPLVLRDLAMLRPADVAWERAVWSAWWRSWALEVVDARPTTTDAPTPSAPRARPRRPDSGPAGGSAAAAAATTGASPAPTPPPNPAASSHYPPDYLQELLDAVPDEPPQAGAPAAGTTMDRSSAPPTFPRTRPASPWRSGDLRPWDARSPRGPGTAPGSAPGTAPGTRPHARPAAGPSARPSAGYSAGTRASTRPPVVDPRPGRTPTVRAARNGVTGQRVRRVLAVSVALVVAAALALVGVSWTSPGSTGALGASLFPERTAAAAVDDVLALGGPARAQVNSAVGSVTACGDADAAATRIRDSIAQRRAQSARIADLEVASLPRGAELRTQLTDAVDRSVAADEAYLDWVTAVGEERCRGTAPKGPKWKRASDRSDSAGKAKRSVAALWAPIAAEQGLAVRPVGEL